MSLTNTLIWTITSKIKREKKRIDELEWYDPIQVGNSIIDNIPLDYVWWIRLQMNPKWFILQIAFLSSITEKTFTGLDYMSKTVGVSKETGTAYHSRAPMFNPVILVGFVLLISLVLCCLFVCLSLFCALCPIVACISR
jgi:hypothetical protein